MSPLDHSELKGGGQQALKEPMLTKATGVEPSQESKEMATKKCWKFPPLHIFATSTTQVI